MTELKEVLDQIDNRGYDAAWAADEIARLFVIIPREQLPPVSLSEHGNGLVTALAQESYQPRLKLEDEVNDGGWSRSIAYANLAIAEAIEGRMSSRNKRRDELADEYTAVNAYVHCTDSAQKLIDRIIDLEAAK